MDASTDVATDAIIDAATDAARDGAVGTLTVVPTDYGDEQLDIALTTEGTLDWAHWGLNGTTSFDHKATGSSIDNLAAPPAGAFSGAPLTASWSDGAPDGSASQTSTGVGVHQGSNMTVAVAAGTTVHTLTLYVGVQCASAELSVSLSDDAVQRQTATLTNSTTTNNVAYAITFAAAAPDQQLVMTWTDTDDFMSCSQGQNGVGFVALLSATLK